MLNADQRELATTVRDSGESMLAIIDDIIGFSKIEAERMEVEAIPLDLRRCIDSALGMVRSRAHEKDLELSAQIADDVPAAVLGDVTRLRQMLLNLLSNTIKFTQRGEVTLTVRRGAGDQLRFTVADTGIGLSEAGMARLFGRFAQAERGTTRQYGGTGLGLAIRKRLVEVMGGTMGVESAGPGRGCSFRFDIAAQAATQPVAHDEPRRIEVDPQMAARHPLRTLLAEDHAVNQKLALRLLQPMGYPADLARDGLEAVSAIESRPCDVVLMDVLMPELTAWPRAARSPRAGRRVSGRASSR